MKNTRKMRRKISRVDTISHPPSYVTLSFFLYSYIRKKYVRTPFCLISMSRYNEEIASTFKKKIGRKTNIVIIATHKDNCQRTPDIYFRVRQFFRKKNRKINEMLLKAQFCSFFCLCEYTTSTRRA